jgi:hypothetical protein
MFFSSLSYFSCGFAKTLLPINDAIVDQRMTGVLWKHS